MQEDTNSHVEVEPTPITGLSTTAQVASIVAAVLALFTFVSFTVGRKVRKGIDAYKQNSNNATKDDIRCLKDNTREHLKNEIQDLSDDIAKEIEHVRELLEQKIDSHKDDLSEAKVETLAAREAALAAQLQLSDALARLDMINQRLNSGK